ncbi:unnamed protein product [Prorocentrum cordatum]|uniref:Uncharacterized protein n=1 Tax=Prorocentrum cordatum TaxID=2364126 RepID=A0ABN9WWV3_9DINO|nr:unnamed protein product [Polarella glacialis]
MSQQTSAYAEQVKAAGQYHTLDTLDIWAAGGVMKARVGFGDAVGARTANELGTAFGKYGDYSVPRECELVPFCRQDRMYQKDSRCAPPDPTTGDGDGGGGDGGDHEGRPLADPPG